MWIVPGDHKRGWGWGAAGLPGVGIAGTHTTPKGTRRESEVSEPTPRQGGWRRGLPDWSNDLVWEAEPIQEARGPADVAHKDRLPGAGVGRRRLDLKNHGKYPTRDVQGCGSGVTGHSTGWETLPCHMPAWEGSLCLGNSLPM